MNKRLALVIIWMLLTGLIGFFIECDERNLTGLSPEQQREIVSRWR